MTVNEIILAVLQRIDEISPSAVAVDMNFGNIIFSIMNGCARDYAAEYPIPSSQVKTLTQKNSQTILGGEKISPTSTDKSQWIRLAEVRINHLVFRDFKPLNHKKRIMIARKIIVPTETNPVIFEYYDAGDNNTPTIEIYPNIDKLTIKFVSTFDPTSIYTENDRGFFDHFLWYLSLRTLQVIGGQESITASIKQIIDNHFSVISKTAN